MASKADPTTHTPFSRHLFCSTYSERVQNNCKGVLRTWDIDETSVYKTISKSVEKISTPDLRKLATFGYPDAGESFASFFDSVKSRLNQQSKNIQEWTEIAQRKINGGKISKQERKSVFKAGFSVNHPETLQNVLDIVKGKMTAFERISPCLKGAEKSIHHWMEVGFPRKENAVTANRFEVLDCDDEDAESAKPEETKKMSDVDL